MPPTFLNQFADRNTLVPHLTDGALFNFGTAELEPFGFAKSRAPISQIGQSSSFECVKP